MKIEPSSVDPNNFMVNAIRYCCALAIVYIILIFALPADKVSMARYHLTGVEYHILLFILTLPTIMVWYVAFYGVAKLQDYAWFIHKTDEGKNLGRIANGANWIAWGLPITSILSLLLFSLADGHRGLEATSTIITNYAQLILPLVGFSLIAQGTQGLITQASAGKHISRARSLILLLVSLGVIFCFFTFRQFNLQNLNSTHNPYHLPIWLMIITLLIPFLYAWFVGVLAAFDISNYGKYLRGVLYRQPLQLMAFGLILVIGGSIATQYAHSLDGQQGSLFLNYFLLLVNLFRLGIGVGFGLIALGVHRLKKIEDI